jgi:hypothetical protein
MLDSLTFAELDAQKPELLPARTALSLTNSSICESGNRKGGPDSTH